MSGDVGGFRVEPLGSDLSAETEEALKRVEEFKSLWTNYMSTLQESEKEERQQRNLRRHAIETGIIERLYDLDWGITEELVADGLSMDVAEKDGDISQATLRTIQAQFDGLSLLVDFIRDERSLSSGFIKELHSTITSTQFSYTARDQFGAVVERQLQRGAWKTETNYVVRKDGSKIFCTEPIHVQDEIDSLSRYFEQYRSDETIHPITLAAWLHHRFIQIHPFSDGNGRVARALMLLVLLQSKFSPIVVRRDDREPYIEALDLANDGNLEPLIRYFARLEEDAIRTELAYRETVVAESAVEVAKQYALRLKNKFEASDSDRREGVEAIAAHLVNAIKLTLEETANELKLSVKEIDENADSWVAWGEPNTEKGRYFNFQIVRAAREVDFYANLEEGAWWVTINLKLRSSLMRFGAIIQKVGRGESGILALTFFGEVSSNSFSHSEEDSRHAPEPILSLKPSDAVNFLHTDDAQTAERLALQAVDRTLTATVSQFFEKLS